MNATALRLFLRANRRHLAELLLAGMLVNLLVLALPTFTMLVYDKAVGNNLHETLWALVIGMALLLALEGTVRTVRVLAVEHAAARWDASLDEQLMRGVLQAPLATPLGVGTVVTRYRDLAGVRDFLSAQYLLPLMDLPFALLFAVALLLVAGPLVLIPLCVGSAMLALTLALQGVAQRRNRVANVAHGRKLATLVDTLLARESLVEPAARRDAVARFRPPSLQGARAAARARLWAQLGQQALPLGLAAGTVMLMVAGVYRIEAQQLSVGGLISATMIGGRLMAAICSQAPVWGRWNEFRHALGELKATVDMAARPETDNVASESTLAAHVLAFRMTGVATEQLSVSYPGQERKVLDGVSVRLRSGELVAVVGASGAGKSTLLRLLAGQLEHSSGQLVCAGERVQDAAARERLAMLAVRKAQDPVFMPGCLREVVAPGAGTAGDAEVLASLRLVGLGATIERGDLGLNTQVGTMGEGLSGGQRQMLAVARALHSQAPLLLMDEPTLGLDHQAQQTLIESLVARKQGQCIVVATHTTELITRCDRVLVLDRGKLVADAPPARLLGGAQSVPTMQGATRVSAPA